MTEYTLVRQAREGRQNETDITHCIEEDSESTVCKSYDRKEVRPVRNISVFIGSSKVCSECGEVISDLMK